MNKEVRSDKAIVRLFVLFNLAIVAYVDVDFLYCYGVHTAEITALRSVMWPV